MAITLDGTLGITSPAETVQGALTTTGNTILGDASTDTLNVGNGGLVKDASGNIGIGTASPQAREDIVFNNTGSATPLMRLGAVLASTTTAATDGGFINYQNNNRLDISRGWHWTNGANYYSHATTGSCITLDESANILFLNGTGLSAGGNSNLSERMRIDSSGNVTLQKNISVGGATPSASGSGITFPATQSASSDANTLDDYEEGTWTPNQGSGLTLVGAFSSSGSYTKTGRQVTVIFQVTGATTVAAAGGGATICTNLPFTQAVNSPVGTVGDNQTASVSGVFYIGSNICFTNTTLTAKNQYLFVATYFIA